MRKSLVVALGIVAMILGPATVGHAGGTAVMGRPLGRSFWGSLSSPWSRGGHHRRSHVLLGTGVPVLVVPAPYYVYAPPPVVVQEPPDYRQQPPPQSPEEPVYWYYPTF